MNNVTSRHVMGAGEVLLWIPIKSGFVEYDEQIISYAARLQLLLTALFEIRRISTERDLVYGASPIERLQTLHRVQWTVVESESRLLVTASFDRSWEGYFRLLADHTGSLLDTIFYHCEDYEGRSCTQNFGAFMDWARSHQKPVNLFFAHEPDLTADDLRLLRQMVHEVDKNGADALGNVRLTELGQQGAFGKPNAEKKDVRRSLEVLFDMRKYWPPSKNALSEEAIYDMAMSQLYLKELPRLQEIEAELRAAIVQTAPLDKHEQRKIELHRWLTTLMQLEKERLSKLVVEQKPVKLSREAESSIQAGILRPYAGTNHGAVVLVQCEARDVWKPFLSFMEEVVSTEAKQLRKGQDVYANIGLTFAGLERMGLSDATLEKFPREFREGMLGRAGLLGDVGDRRYFEEPGAPGQTPESPRVRLHAVDAVLILQVADNEPATAKLSELAKKLKDWLDVLTKSVPGVRVLHQQALYRHASDDGPRREHFGYVEDASAKNSGSQPVPSAHLSDGTLLSQDAAPSDVVPLGELLLGYNSSRGASISCNDGELGHDLFKDSSFLVVRKLQQDVKAFNDYVAAQKDQLGSRPDADKHFRALLMGRYPDGEPVEPVQDPHPNELKFSTGACPAFAHIRRVNPRTELLGGIPRILRRGFTYGPKLSKGNECADRGLMFMAYNASIAEQFEVLQRWINGGNSTGLLSSQKDIIAGQGPVISPIKYRLCPADHETQHAKPISFSPPTKALVTLDWGLYLFVPARETLKALTGLHERSDTEAGVYGSENVDPNLVDGRAIIARIRALEAVDQARARDLWKHTLEGSPSDAEKLWKAVGAEPRGVLSTLYGVLVADRAAAKEVLDDDGKRFSVSEYGNRLARTVGEHYLGIDTHSPHYDRLAREPNKLIHALPAEGAYALAHQYAKMLLDLETPVKGRRTLPLRELSESIVYLVCQEWFGLSDAKIPPLSAKKKLNAIVFSSRYAFQVRPGPWVRDRISDMRDDLSPDVAPTTTGVLRQQLLAAGYNERDLELALDGAMIGFAAPAIATIVSVSDTWLASGDFWRLSAIMNQASGFAAAQKTLLPELLSALAKRPVPSLLYRYAPEGAVLAGNITIPPGVPVILGLSALYTSAVAKEERTPEAWLFGGSHRSENIGNKTQHGCPARNVALAVTMGALAAVMARNKVEIERRFVISYE